MGSSVSLWNISLQTGWTQEEYEVLKTALMKFGIGRWSLIVKSGALPAKNVSQYYLQTQKMLG